MLDRSWNRKAEGRLEAVSTGRQGRPPYIKKTKRACLGEPLGWHIGALAEVIGLGGPIFRPSIHTHAIRVSVGHAGPFVSLQLPVFSIDRMSKIGGQFLTHTEKLKGSGEPNRNHELCKNMGFTQIPFLECRFLFASFINGNP